MMNAPFMAPSGETLAMMILSPLVNPWAAEVVTVTTSLGKVTTNGYDTAGNLTSVSDPLVELAVA